MTRKKSGDARIDAVSRQLREMFAAAEAMPIPDRLMSVIDQLDEGEPLAAQAPRRVAGSRAISG